LLKRIVSGIVLTMLLIEMSTLAFNFQLVKAEPKIWTVDDDGPADFHTIQEAVNAANPADTIFVCSGTYKEHQVTIQKPLTLIGENKSTTVIDGNGSWVCVYVQSTHNVTISGFTVRNGYGIYSYASEDVTISENIVSDSGQGIILIGSTHNTISKNIVTLNSLSILLSENSDDNKVSENMVLLNSGDAIWLDNSHRNIICRNNVSNNGLGTAPGYHVFGIRLSFSDNNTIHHNIIIDNYEQADSWMSTNNVWDDGYPSGGNYWSDYAGVDLYSGPYQNETGWDGIGDTPYVIGGSDQDRYPFMDPRIHDVAVVSVIPSITEVYVGQVVNITVIIQNKGKFTETFEVAYKYKLEGAEYVIGFIIVSDLAPQANTSVVFSWETIDIAVYKIRAEATLLLSEIITSDNTMTSPTTVKVTILGDVNGDYTVNILDLVKAANSFGATPSSGAWNPQADIYLDGFINIFDLIKIVFNFGKTA